MSLEFSPPLTAAKTLATDAIVSAVMSNSISSAAETHARTQGATTRHVSAQTYRPNPHSAQTHTAPLRDDCVESQRLWVMIVWNRPRPYTVPHRHACARGWFEGWLAALTGAGGVGLEA
eukprot:1615741-Prymnesium_polylepis.1